MINLESDDPVIMESLPNLTNCTEINVPSVAYVAAEVFVAAVAVSGNIIVIMAFIQERRLRRVTNYYIMSLATADCLVGLFGVPFAILTSYGRPQDRYGCLFMLSILLVLCTISILHLVAVSVDRFWAILFPLLYARMMSTRVAHKIIGSCWFLGSIIGFLPVFGWHNVDHPKNCTCKFLEVMDLNFLAFLFFATIVFPSVLLIIFYGQIYCVVLKQLRKISSMESFPSGERVNGIRIINRKDVRAAKNLFIIVVFFIICWMPLYTLNCVMAFNKTRTDPTGGLLPYTIVLSHANSALNPLLYAFNLRDFREAMGRFLFCSRKPARTSTIATVSHATIAREAASTPVSLLNVKR